MAPLAVLFACAVCAAGDPNVDAVGTERAFEGRLRLSADARAGSVDAGGTGLADRRLEIATTWAPARDLALTLGIPALDRTIRQNGAYARRTSLGDVEVRASHLAWSDDSAAFRPRFGILAGAKAPTAPLERGADGTPLPSTLQPGCGAIVPLVGAYGGGSRGMLSLYASATFLMPVSVRSGPHSGDSLRAAAYAQIQPLSWFGVRLGASARLDGTGELAPDVADRDSGGFVGYGTGEIVASIRPDLVVAAGTFVPVVQALAGAHREAPIAVASVAYDF
jgi:hypothetical protein